MNAVLFTFAWPNTGSAGRYGSADGKLQYFSQGQCNLLQNFLSSCSSIIPLIMISQEIRVKQVNYSFGKWSSWSVCSQQPPRETVYVDT